MRLAPKAQTLLERFALAANLVPEPALETHIALLSARAIMAASELGIFVALAREPLDAQQIADRCGLNTRASEALMGSLAALGYVHIQDSKFALMRKSRKWMSSTEASSLYNYMPHVRDVWNWATRLEDFVRKGQAIDVHKELSQGEWSRYQRAMRALADPSAAEVAYRLALPNHPKRMLDIGGAHGLYSVTLCRKHPSLSSLILELPPAIESAAPVLAAEAMGDRVTHLAGSFRIQSTHGAGTSIRVELPVSQRDVTVGASL